MQCGNMNSYNNNLSGNNNSDNNNNNNNINNNDTDEDYSDYPFDYSNNGCFGGYKYYHHRTQQIFEYNCGTSVNLDKMNVQDNVVAAQLTVDIEGNNKNHGKSANTAQIRISYNCFLNYTASLNEEMDIMFKLYRQESNAMRIELTSKPYTVSFKGDLTTTNENVTESVPLQLEKNESFYTEYFDEVKGGGTYTYIMEVSMIYNSIDSSSLQAGYISATGLINRESER